MSPIHGESTLILNPASGKGTEASQVPEILKLLPYAFILQQFQNLRYRGLTGTGDFEIAGG